MPTAAETRKPRSAYACRVSHYENEEGMALLEELSRRRGGLSLTALIRQLTREEAARVGLVPAAGV